MNNIISIDPWSILDDLFGTGSRMLRTARARAVGKYPPANVYLDDSAVMIDLELPGKNAADVDLTLEPEAAVISDKPTADADGKVTASPAWSRRIDLPFRVNADKANAKFDNGILRIVLPKAEATGVRRIAIAD